ncbi:SPFH domain-containing protein [Nonomuraea pusilla]|uniref:Regulator of protease activity HflC, stomatin/prohibitin superfamily n=1 Tax=Nonomuraea pusilla TaxID=46177 RepID=A0A1H7R525_9ACTN|nr:SPFH domain-containing protein [Nonomuraea pusilla]SEL55229.1 Regulator of protease activity HflC, stomatin/prohibitin superfamily [Nonomuraea pusilla]
MTDTSIAVEMPAPQTQEQAAWGAKGWPMLALAAIGPLAAIVLIPLGATMADEGSAAAGATLIVLAVLLLLAACVIFTGLTAVAPGEARVIQLLGRYVGTVRTPGLRFVVPFTQKQRVSTRIRNHETDVTKVNDADGNPIEMAAVVVWQVEDTAKAIFEVDDFLEFVAFQTETAVRHIAGSYPYDGHDDTLSLRENADEITGRLSAEIQARVASAGVKVIESRITRLAYAPEIAQAMLRRQQAGAVVAARQRIVEGAVGMVEAALARLDEHDVIELDEERKATMVSNLLVVLCGDRDVQPVVNTGSLYH